MQIPEYGYPEDLKPSVPPHPFTPDVVEWARGLLNIYKGLVWRDSEPARVKAARQILDAVGEG